MIRLAIRAPIESVALALSACAASSCVMNSSLPTVGALKPHRWNSRRRASGRPIGMSTACPLTVHRVRWMCRTFSACPRLRSTGNNADRLPGTRRLRFGIIIYRSASGLVSGQNGGMRDRLRLFPEYAAETPVWSRRGMVSFSRLKISDALRADLIAWQNEALDPSDERAERSEEEWEAEGRLLAARLAEETGLRVDLDI